MPAEIVPYFLIYAALFRLAIIAAGVISIVLGYRLFSMGVWSDIGAKETTIDIKTQEASFTLKNAAPGTIFAFFGAIIIGIMLFKGAPELTSEMIMPNNSVKPGEETPTVSKMTLRGNETVEASSQRCIDEYGKGKIDDAIEACRQAIKPSTKSMNNLAWIYKEQGKLTEAFPLAKMAVVMNPEETDYLKTLATILCQVKNDESLRKMEKAIEQAPNYEKFSKQFKEYKKIHCD